MHEPQAFQNYQVRIINHYNKHRMTISRHSIHAHLGRPSVPKLEHHFTDLIADIIKFMTEKNQLFSDLSVAFDEKLPHSRLLEIIKRPLSEIALASAADSLNIRPVSRHPLGFYTLTLAQGVCMHLWPQTYPVDEPFPDNTVLDIHQHSWDLQSWILEGRLGNQRAKVVSSGGPSYLGGLREYPRWMTGGDYYRVFDAQSGADGVDYMKNMNYPARLESLGDEEWYEPGQTYSLPVGNFHSSNWEIDTTTLMLATTYPGCRNLTLGPVIAEYDTDETDSHYVPRLTYSRKRTIAIAAELAIRLDIDG